MSLPPRRPLSSEVVSSETASPRSSAAAPPILEVRDLTVRYGSTVAVDGVSLAIEEPGILALLGQSGCGKTSLLRAIAGFEVPDAGTITIAGRQIAGPGGDVPPERRQVGMVFQEGALFPHLTVLENIAYGLRRRRSSARRADRRALDALELVGLATLADRFPDQLSGGQQQRVALARALAPAPRLVLLDEPFASLDAGLRQRVREEVRQILSRAGATAVLVTHDQEEAFSVADRVAVMSGGRVLQVATPDEIYHRPANLEVATFVGDSQLFDCTVEAGRIDSSLGRASAVELPAVAAGPGLLLARCEDLRLEAVPRSPSVLAADGGRTAGGLTGELVQRRFFGHDQLDEVLLDSGERVRVRSLSSVGLPLGTRVRIRLRDKPFQVFPRTGSAGEATGRRSE